MTGTTSSCLSHLYGKCVRRSRHLRKLHESAMDFIRTPRCSARVLVAVKTLQQAESMLALLLRVLQKDDYVLFMHVSNHSECELKSPILEKSIRTSFSCTNKLPKVTISTLTMEAPNVRSAIVDEARKIRATMLLLGCSHSPLLSRSMHEIGRHCVSNLSCYCRILIVRRAKVLHVRPGSAKCKDRTLKAFFQKQRVEEKGKSIANVTADSASEIMEYSRQSSRSGGLIILPEGNSTNNSSFFVTKPVVCSPNSVLDHRPNKERQRSCSSSSSSSDIDGVRRFTYDELSIATGSFAKENLVGNGGCCSVYRGTLRDGNMVAVKKLLDTKIGRREFSREIKVVSFISHENLVTLLGFCNDDPHKMLVYELMENGCLQRHLQGDSTLNWRHRQRIALGAAKGLQHLHELTPHHVIHQDIKSSNILLSKDFDALISDFGFAKWSNELYATCSGILGTFGYMAPEYIVHGVASEKTDVFSFGVVLLEIITGKSPLDSSLPIKNHSIVHWALSLEETGATYKMVDPRLRDIDAYEMRRMMHAALLCIRRAPEERPTAKRLVNILDPDVICPEPLLAKHNYT